MPSLLTQILKTKLDTVAYVGGQRAMFVGAQARNAPFLQ